MTIEVVSGFLSHFIAQYCEVIGEQSSSSLGHIHIYSRVAQHSDLEKFAFPESRMGYYNVDTSLRELRFHMMTQSTTASWCASCTVEPHERSFVSETNAEPVVCSKYAPPMMTDSMALCVPRATRCKRTSFGYFACVTSSRSNLRSARTLWQE